MPKRRTPLVGTVALAVAAWALAGPGHAGAAPRQAAQGGVIAGRVIGRAPDSTADRPVAGAIVRIVGLERKATSDDAGEFSFSDVPAGRYEVHCAADGFKTLSQPGIAVRTGETARVTLTLEPEAMRIEERVDVVGRLPRRSESQPGSAFTLTGTQLTTISGTMGDFGRTLRSIPAAAGMSDERNTIVARGGNPAENGFFIDNMEVPNTSHLPDWGSTGGLYSLIDPSAVSSFDFIVGGFPAKFGGFLSSMTDITYREGSRDRIKGQARFDIAMAAVAAEGPLPGKKGSWRASVRHADFTYLREIISLDDQNPRWTDAHLKAQYDLSPRHTVSVLDVFSSDRLLEHHGGGSDHRDKIDQNTVGLNWRASWSDTVRSETSASYSRLTRSYGQEYAPPDSQYDWADRRKTEWFAFRNENTLSVGESTLIQFGAQARRYSHEVGYVVVPTLPGTILISTGPWLHRTTETAAYVSGVARPFARFGTTAGVRVEHSTASGRTHVSPRASASFRLLETLHVNAAAAVVYQPLPSDFLAVNPGTLAMRDMRADQYSIGLSYAGRQRWRATLEAYNKHYADLPVDPSYSHRLILDREPFRGYTVPVTLTDDGRGRSRGLELMLERRGGRLTAIASGRVSRDTYTDLRGVSHNRLYDSRYALTLAADWAPSAAWSLSSTLVVQDGAPYTPTNAEASAALGMWVRRGGLYNTLRYPAYVTLNARIERRFVFGKTAFAVFADCWNLLGRRNVGWIEDWNSTVGDVYKYQMPRTPFIGAGIMF